MRTYALYIITIGFLLGDIFSLLLNLETRIFAIVVFCCATIFLNLKITGYKNLSSYYFSLAIVLVFFFGMYRGQVALFYIDHNSLSSYISEHKNKNILIEGQIVTDPVTIENKTSYVLEISSVEHQTLQNKIKAKISQRFYFDKDLKIDDVVSVEGTLQTVKNFKTKNGREFEYQKFLASTNIFYQFKVSQIISQKIIYTLQKSIVDFKHEFIIRFFTYLPYHEAVLMSGLLVSGKSMFPSYLVTQFQKAGLIHIVVLSGFNVSIVIGTAMFIFFRIPFVRRWQVLFLGILSIYFFVLMVGSDPPVLRAAFMSFFALLARLLYRKNLVSRTLLFSVLCISVLYPLMPIYNPSFLLSVIATAGVIHFSPLFLDVFYFLPQKFAVRDFISATIGTQIFVLPFLLYLTGNFSLISFLVNIIVLPFVPIIMLLGVILFIFSYISVYVSVMIAIFSHTLIAGLFWIVEHASNLSISTIPIQMPIVTMFFWYIVFLTLIFLKRDIR